MRENIITQIKRDIMTLRKQKQKQNHILNFFGSFKKHNLSIRKQNFRNRNYNSRVRNLSNSKLSPIDSRNLTQVDIQN